MKPRFIERALLKVYLERKDLLKLTERSIASGKLMGEYVRDLVLEDLAREVVPPKKIGILEILFAGVRPEDAPVRHAVAHHPTCGCRSCELQNK